MTERAEKDSGGSAAETDKAASPAMAATKRSAVMGAMFLMATSAIGPGFLTQTSAFTAQLGAALAFAIVLSLIVDIGVQLNVWRVMGVSGMRANELGNTVVPGLGWVMGAFVFFGGLVFNVGNIAGAGLGLNAMLGMDATVGGLIAAGVAIVVFLSKRAGAALDKIVVFLGAVMILLTLYVAISSQPPVGEALKNVVAPEQVDVVVITTLIGGTVGGYITFAGAHRIIDSGLTGPEHVGTITRSSIAGILVTGVMRIVLFLAVLGVVATGVSLSQDNVARDVFFHAAGEIGVRIFGIVLFSAGLTSVIGAAYTSVTFVTKQSTRPAVRTGITVALIAGCALVFALLKTPPQTLLIFAGAFNGLILPIGFAVVLWVGFRRRDLLRGYRYPRWLLAVGVVVWLFTVVLGISSVAGIAALWQ
ncbi:NRAMP family divalent metal transporter [Corynebacterium otitidis]|uniref:Putative membrane protein n=1 Tax=Corynebacterium otitidis ATCC 51513 TaxID=883169 RepID=I7L7Z2_9CORY|nr:NRAMP family divalent metal transporter [Corynebacterium otitidis]EJZ82668.1 hypothetical protein HMPREF9719_00399 [Corynebacterium otitidis ATCC 51513]CCI82902.1 putative membrane protein [Corynebacterium otitidis ATCC 51513]